MGIVEFLTFLFIGIGLSFDSFAVSVSWGMMKKEILFNQAVPIAFSLAFFQTLFPVLGWIAGTTIHDFIYFLDHWIAFILLASIGVKMIIEGKRPSGPEKNFDPFRLKIVLGLSVATSIDALVVGFSFGFLDTPIFFLAGIIGCVTFVASMLGMLFGKNIPARLGSQSLIIGGIILIAIGTKILAEHIWFN
jgi:putative Mn2+ efflux pump MntP